MAFRFPLATVLRVRESVEKREELTLQKIQLEAARIRHLIEVLTAEIANLHDKIDKAVQRSVQANHLQSMLREVSTAAEARQILSQSLKALEQQRDQQLKVYRAAYSARQMLTNLLTKSRESYELEQARTQQKQLDDIFAARFQRS